MREARYVLAVDGGGTKTAVALLDRGGRELATARAGPANLYREPGAGLAAIHEAWRAACAAAGLDPLAVAPSTVVSAGLAGIGGEAQRRAFQAAFAGFAGRRLSGDGYTAFVGAFGAGAGALLLVGTGVIAYRRRAAGGPLQARGGWGFPVADRGSGAWLGFRLVGDYLGRLDGCATPASPLWGEVEARLGREREPILAWLAGARAADFAALAPAIVGAAEAGDPLGESLLAEGTAHLLELAAALRPTASAPLCLGGGLAAAYRPRLAAALGPALLPATARPDPIRGAWLVARGEVPPEFPAVA